MCHEPADAFGHLGAQAAPLLGPVPRARDDARDEHRPQGETGGVRRERQGHAGGEQEGADRGRQQLIRKEERTLHPRARDAEVLAGHETRDKRAAGRVGEGLCGPKDEQDNKHHGDVDRAGDDDGDQCAQHQGASHVHHDDHPPSIKPVCRRSAQHAEQQDRKVLAEECHRDKERIARLGCDEQWSGRDHDAIARVVDDGCRQEPAEAPPKPPRRNGLDDPGTKGSHA